MRLKPAVASLVLMAAMAAVIPAQSLTTTEDLESYIRRFLTRVVRGDLEQAFRLVRNNPRVIPTEEVDALQSSTADQLAGVKESYGSIRSYRYLDRQEIDDLLIQYTYLTPMDRYVLRWRFIFFNNGNEWMLTQLEWDDRLEQLFNW